jgi:hypothetical protein
MSLPTIELPMDTIEYRSADGRVEGRGRLFVLSGPSGVGKGSLLKALIGHLPGIVRSVSATTRAARTGEIDGVDYHFLSREQFLADIADGTLSTIATTMVRRAAPSSSCAPAGWTWCWRSRCRARRSFARSCRTRS